MQFEGLEINITKSKRKTISIYIERDGSISALVPDDIDNDKLKEVIKTKEYQIHKSLAQWQQLNGSKIDRDYVNGQSFMYLGRNYRLKIEDNYHVKLLLKKGYFVLPTNQKVNAKELFVNFYKDKLKEKILPIIERYQAQLGVKPKEIKIMELQNRWASCTQNTNINFHWKCAMAPIDVLNYIVVHELAHLIHSNHTTAFWNEVDKVIPNYDKHLQWLRNNGATMDL